MGLTATGRRATDRDQSPVHRWRVSQLARLGIPRPLAETYAERVDWHQVARLVQRGCPRGWRCASPAERRVIWLALRMTDNEDDHDGDSYQRAEHRE